MSESQIRKVGAVAWVDLTVPDAERIRDFYSQVAGWMPQAVDMGGYADFNMLPPGAEAPAAGVCHARGVNLGLPPQWLIYIIVDDLQRSVQNCLALGGIVVADRRQDNGHGFVVIQDPAGAVAALYSPAPAS